MQAGPSEELFKHAARFCFYTISLHQLKTLCTQFGVSPPTPDLLGHLQTLLACLLDASADETKEMLMMRCVLPANPLADLISDDMMLEELVPKGEMKVFHDLLFVISIACSVSAVCIEAM